MPNSTIISFDSTTAVTLLAIALGVFGMRRGVRSEGITLAGVLGASVVFNGEGMGDRLVATVNRIPRVLDLLLAPDAPAAFTASSVSGWLKTPDQKLAFSVIFFSSAVVLFFYLGSKYGGEALTRGERLIGGAMGAVSGLAIGYTGVGFSHSYVSLHPDVEGTTFTIPSMTIPSISASSSVGQYAPLAFLVAMGVIAILAVSSFRKAKQ